MLRNFVLACFVLLAFSPGGCGYDGENFSQYPGFVQYFEMNPPTHQLPGAVDRDLLYRFRPRFMLPQGHPGLIDFYGDYVANGTFLNGRGTLISERVTSAELNRHKDDPTVVFVHTSGSDPLPPVVYGRIVRETLLFDTIGGRLAHRFTFLTYHAVFRSSGIPAGIPSWQERVLGLLGDLDDWHQLDHFTAVTVVLERDGHGARSPIAVMLQQHNHLRTYLVGESITVPADGRVVIDVAIRSNELYPHSSERTRHRAVSLPDPKSIRFLLTGKGKPLYAGYDITHGVREAGFQLDFLPPDDAFYTFKGFLGVRRRLPGRDGPPGADYNTLPALKPLSMQLFIGYWRENHAGDLDRFERTIGMNGDYEGFARLQSIEFYRNWTQQAIKRIDESQP